MGYTWYETMQDEYAQYEAKMAECEIELEKEREEKQRYRVDIVMCEDYEDYTYELEATDMADLMDKVEALSRIIGEAFFWSATLM